MSDKDRIAQIVIHSIPKLVPIEVDVLDTTERGTGGFGSTGRSSQSNTSDLCIGTCASCSCSETDDKGIHG